MRKQLLFASVVLNNIGLGILFALGAVTGVTPLMVATGVMSVLGTIVAAAELSAPQEWPGV